jgi:hypothetical protein
MKIALIGCPFWGTIYGPNYTLGILAALVKEAGHEPIVFDLNIDIYNQVSEKDKKIYWDYDNHHAKYHKFDILCKRYQKELNSICDMIVAHEIKVIAFSVTMFSSDMSVILNRELKHRNPKLITIFGGVNCFNKYMALTYLDDQNIDMVCIGEAELVMQDMLKAIDLGTWKQGIKGFLLKRNGEILDGGVPEIRMNLDLTPLPDYSLFDLSKYTTQNKYTTLFSRGCINRCTFCYEHMIHKKYRYRSAQNVIEEIKAILQNTGLESLYINFADSMINGSIAELIHFCDMIIAEGLSVTWWGQAAARKSMTREVLSKMKLAGCSGVSWGVETGSDFVLRLMNKNTNMDLIKRIIKDAHEIGLIQNTNLIIGFPGERECDFLETCIFVIENLKYLSTVGTTLLSIEENAPIHSGYRKYNIKDPNAKIEWETLDGMNNINQRMKKEKILRKLIGTKYLGELKTDFNIVDPFLDQLHNRVYNSIMPMLKNNTIKAYDKVILYGSGDWARRFTNVFESNGIQIFAYLDSNPDKWGRQLFGKPIINPEELYKLEPECKVIIASSSRRAISKKLQSLGFVENVNFFGFDSIS